MTTQDHPTETPNQAEQVASTARHESSTADAGVGQAAPVRGQADAMTSDTTSRPAADPSGTETESTTPPADRPEADSAPTTGQAQRFDTPDAPTTAQAEPSASDPAATTEISLFGATELSGFRSRWDDVQAAFVDDPRQCVQKADALVSEVVDQLTAGFSEARSRMEAQWARGEEASTEDLRLALKRYREFFQRLLAV
jgi:hypothetical protein